MRFFDREMELERLGEITAQAFRSGGRLTVMTGRRRVGKTELIRQHMKEVGGIYWFVGRRHVEVLKDDFGRVAAERFPQLRGARYERISDLLRAVLLQSRSEPLLLVIDEFQNLLQVDPGAFSEVQAIWDELHHDARCHLLVAGSMYTMIRQIFEDRKEPLFGRATDRMRVQPFTPSVVREILEEHDRVEDLLPFYAIMGGIPRYYELVDKNELWRAPLDKVLERLIFERGSILYDEGRALLLEEFGRDHQVYFSVLAAIAAGNTRANRIADATGLVSTSLSNYLSKLEKRYEVVERRVPFGESKSRRGRYRLRDPFLSFWFRYIYRNASFLEVGAARRVVDRVMEDLPNHLCGAFEDLCAETLLERTRRGEDVLGLDIEELGRWWDRGKAEIDLVARCGDQALLIECKVSPARFSADALSRFKRNVQAFSNRFPKLKIVLAAVSYGTPTARQRRVWADGGIELLSYRELAKN